MTMLALEFSSEVRSAALLRDHTVLSQAAESGGRSTRAFSLIERVLKEAAIPRERVERMALGLGPGSYTGIRVAISIAQGWQLALGVKLIGINTVESMAEQARRNGVRGRVHVALDAQRDEFYHAAFDLDDDRVRGVSPLHLAGLEEVGKAVQGDPVLCWAGVARHFLNARVTPPDAAVLGSLASSRADFVSGAQLEPVYLRPTNFVKAPPPRALGSH